MLTAYLVWKAVKKTSIVSLESVPILDALEQAEQHPEEIEPAPKGAIRYVSWMWD